MALGENYVSTIIKRSIVLIAIGCIICLFLFDNPVPYASGLALGGLANMLAFKLLEMSTKRAVNMPEGKAKTHATLNYFIRYVIYGIVLVIAAKVEQIEFITAIIGLFVVKIVIITDSIYDTIRPQS